MTDEAKPHAPKTGFRPRWLGVAAFLTAATIIASFTVAYLVNGSLLETVSVVDLRSFGGTTFEDLRNLEIWRIATAQLLHAKAPHMLFNALSLFLLGALLEHAIGALRLLAIWLIAGGAATVISTIFVEAPWNVGTGASQAVFAFAGCAVVLAAARTIDRRWAIGLVTLAVIPGLLLDFIFDGYPKPGHVAGFVFGAVFGLVFQTLWLGRERLSANSV